MAQLPESFGKVTYEETRVQAATTQDLVTKLGSNHAYLHEKITDTLPANDAVQQAGIDAMMARNPNVRITMVKTWHLDFSRSDFVPTVCLRQSSATQQTASLVLFYFDDDGKLKADLDKEVDIETFPLGELRAYMVGMRGDVEHTDFDVYRMVTV